MIGLVGGWSPVAANRFCDGSCVCCWDDTKGPPNTNVSEDPSAEGKQRIGYNGHKYIYHESRIEIEYYCIVYFEHITEFDVF